MGRKDLEMPAKLLPPPRRIAPARILSYACRAFNTTPEMIADPFGYSDKITIQARKWAVWAMHNFGGLDRRHAVMKVMRRESVASEKYHGYITYMANCAPSDAFVQHLMWAGVSREEIVYAIDQGGTVC